MALLNLFLVLCGLVAYCSAEQTAAERLVVGDMQELEAVARALYKLQNAELTFHQKTLATQVVKEVEQITSELQKSEALTSAQREGMLKRGLDELEGLQAHWELVDVERHLAQVEGAPHLSAKHRAEASHVRQGVEFILEGIEKGRLKGDARKKKIAVVIQELQDLERDVAGSSSAEEQGKGAKAGPKTGKEGEVNLAKVQKSLSEEKGELKELVSEQSQAEALEKRSKGASQKDLESRLLDTAQKLAASKGEGEGNPKEHGPSATKDSSSAPGRLRIAQKARVPKSTAESRSESKSKGFLH